MNKKKSIVWLVVVTIVIVLATAFGFAPRFAISKADDFSSALNLVQLGSDFQSGSEYVIYTANEYYMDVYGNYTDKEGNVVDEGLKVAKSAEDLQEALNKAAEVIKRRLELLGATELDVAVLDGKKIRVEFIGSNDSSTIFDSFVTNRGTVTMMVCDVEPTDETDFSEYEEVLTKDQYNYVQAFSDSSSSSYGVYFEIVNGGAKELYKATSTASSSNTLYLTLLLDGKLAGYLSLSEAIAANSTYISVTGISSANTAVQVGLCLESGDFDVDFVEEHITVNELDAKLGENAATNYFLAIVIITAVAGIAMIVLYGLNGFVAFLALLVFATLTVFMTAFIPVMLFSIESYIGIVIGLVVAIVIEFISLDSIAYQYNKLGRSRLDAIKDGLKKAFWINLDTSVAVLLAAVFVAIFVPTLTGFAMSVIYSIIASAISSMAILRGLLLLVRFSADNDKLYGYKRQEN